eukprot:Hpha_TRINITY_DN1701_c0_g1::TRINITY_DN1701_c0_g1_i1::g.158584::m.158584
MPQVGDSIRVRYDARDPGGRWGEVQPGMSGNLVGKDPYLVDFPGVEGWVARLSELDCLPYPGEEDGQEHPYVARGNKLLHPSEGHAGVESRYQEQHLRDMFGMFDADGSGQVDKEEAELLLKATGMNPTQETFEDWFKAVDTDGSGKISFEEFANAVKANHHAADSRQEAVYAFQLFDTKNLREKGKKRISVEEFFEQVKVVDSKATLEEVKMVFGHCVSPDKVPGFLDVDDWLRITDAVVQFTPAQRQKLGCV